MGKRPIGWVRAVEPITAGPRHGLAVLRLAEAAEALKAGDRLVVEGSKLVVHPFAPVWWPENVIGGLPTIDICENSS